MTKSKQPKVRNPFEKSVANFLAKNNTLFQYEEIKLPYLLERLYLTDFTIYDKKTGSLKLIVETKGYFRAQDQVKMKAVKRAHPEADIRIVFQNASKKIRKGAKLTYGDWAIKWGFPFAEGQIPKSWIK